MGRSHKREQSNWQPCMFNSKVLNYFNSISHTCRICSVMLIALLWPEEDLWCGSFSRRRYKDGKQFYILKEKWTEKLNMTNNI